ncbi:MAG: DUF433 domain-containing protein [Elusimicrobia bacterium]|nr:DUF433 domain-containing protein [Elusimicrobiota bacterium]
MLVRAWTRISFDPVVMGGQACIRGLRIPVATIVKLAASGRSTEKILENYSDLEAEDVAEALRYAAALAEERLLGG